MTPPPLRFDRREFAGAFGDLGTDLPLLVGVVLVAGLDPSTVFVVFGALQIVTGLAYRLPMPVQPLKAMAAIAIAGGATPPELMAGGLIVGAVMLLLAGTGLLEGIARAVPAVIVRGIQFGLGLSLARLALGTYVAQDGTTGWLFAGLLLLIALTLRTNRHLPGALVILALGLVAAALTWPADVGSPLGWQLPTGPAAWPDGATFGRAALLLALPQLALSLGNSVLATRQVVRDFLPDREAPTIRRIGLTYGLMNLAAAPLGGMPACHGSGGFVGHFAFGGRTGGSVVLYGVFFVLAGLALSGDPAAFQRLFPGPVLGVLLLVEAVSLLSLVRDQAAVPRALTAAVLCGLVAVYAPYGYAVALVAGTLVWRIAARVAPLPATDGAEGAATIQSAARVTGGVVDAAEDEGPAAGVPRARSVSAADASQRSTARAP